MHSSPYNWPHLVACLLVAVTAVLLCFGALVTTYEAAMAVPDWPATYGHNLFLFPFAEWFWGPWDLFLEHGHRLLGALVGLLSLVLAAVAALLPTPSGIGRLRSGRDARPRRACERKVAPAPAPPQRPGPAPVAAADTDSIPDAGPMPAGFRQRTERYETTDGVDCLRGRAIMAVATGSRTGFAHVGFCPSFAATPQVEVSSDYDGVEAELIVAETLPWGVRLECRLAEPAEEPLEIPIDFEARLSPPTP